MTAFYYKFISGYRSAKIIKIGQGLKYLKMSTTHREGRWRSRRPRGRHGGAKRRRAWRWGLGRGAVAPPQYGGLWALFPENFEI